MNCIVLAVAMLSVIKEKTISHHIKRVVICNVNNYSTVHIKYCHTHFNNIVYIYIYMYICVYASGLQISVPHKIEANSVGRHSG